MAGREHPPGLVEGEGVMNPWACMALSCKAVFCMCMALAAAIATIDCWKEAR